MAEAVATLRHRALSAARPFKWMTSAVTSSLNCVTSAASSSVQSVTSAFSLDRDEEELQYTEEPHASRRREILRKHPEIKRLMGSDSTITWIIAAEVVTQMTLSYLVRDAPWPNLLVLGYCLSALLNQSLAVGLHELGHNLAFGHRRGWLNRALGIFANLPLVVPLAVTFKKYHADHHRYLGEKVTDTDVPTSTELWFFRSPTRKIFWMVFHPVFYAVRPFYKSPKPFTGWEVVNIAVQLVFNYLVFSFLGVKSLMYLFLGFFTGLSLHPLAAHFISEHYFLAGGQPTHSYYGPLNYVLFNAGYHNEHHDFPYVPYYRLPEVRRLAPEFYAGLPHHTSWVKVVWDFVWDTDTAPHARGQFREMVGCNPGCGPES